MSPHHPLNQPVLTFADAERSPLSIRAKALMFVDPRSRKLYEAVERLAPAHPPVLIHGETGTGKELLARHIHRASGRPGLFVALNCASLSPQHAEAELFGHAPGVYNGSASSRAGWFGSCRCRCKASCCARWKPARCCASAPARRARWTCAWSPPPAST